MILYGPPTGLIYSINLIYFVSSLNYNILQGCWMLESDWLTNILRFYFQGNAWLKYSSRKVLIALQFHITSPKVLNSIQQQKNQNPQRHWPSKYSKQQDKNNKVFPCFLPQNYLLLCTESILFLPLSYHLCVSYSNN